MYKYDIQVSIGRVKNNYIKKVTYEKIVQQIWYDKQLFYYLILHQKHKLQSCSLWNGTMCCNLLFLYKISKETEYSRLKVH